LQRTNKYNSQFNTCKSYLLPAHEKCNIITDEIPIEEYNCDLPPYVYKCKDGVRIEKTGKGNQKYQLLIMINAISN